jgi:hypothetical protein
MCNSKANLVGEEGAAMTSQNILDLLVALFPEFATSWNSPDNCFREENGSFTRFGVFAEFSTYFRDHYEQLLQSVVAVLGGLLTEWVASPDTELRDAVPSCFLETSQASDSAPTLDAI